MTGLFEERDRGYEAKWAHDAETQFKVMARRNELLGRWAGIEMGMSAIVADEYAQTLVKHGVMSRGADPVFEKIRADFTAKDIVHSDRAIHHKMEELFTEAAREWDEA